MCKSIFKKYPKLYSNIDDEIKSLVIAINSLSCLVSNYQGEINFYKQQLKILEDEKNAKTDEQS